MFEVSFAQTNIILFNIARPSMEINTAKICAFHGERQHLIKSNFKLYLFALNNMFIWFPNNVINYCGMIS